MCLVSAVVVLVQILVLLDLGILLEGFHCVKNRIKWGSSNIWHESVPPNKVLLDFLLS